MRPSRRAARWGAPALLMVLAASLGALALAWPASSFDEQVLLVDPLRVLHGDVPYRDFATAYGPAHWWLLAGAYKLLAPSVLVERCLGLGVHVGLVLATWAVVRPLGSRKALLSGVVSVVLLYPLGTAPYAWLVVCALCLGALTLQAHHDARLPVAIAGLLQALAVGVRPDALLLALLPALLLLRASGHRRAWLAGAALGSLPLLVSILLAPSGTFKDVLLSRAWGGVSQSRLPLWPAATDERRLALLLLVTLALGVGAAARGRARPLVALTLTGLLAAPEALQRLDAQHALYATVLCVPFLPQFLAVLLPATRVQLLAVPVAALAFVGGAGPVAVRPLADTLAGNAPHAVVLHRHGRSLPVTAAHAAALQTLAPVLDPLEQRGGALFVYDGDLVQPEVTDLAVYYLWPGFAQHAHNIDVAPGVSNSAHSGLATDVERADVVVLVTTAAERRATLFPYARPGSQGATDALRRLFCERARAAYYVVFTRCSA